jgi:hypothetical protein
MRILVSNTEILEGTGLKPLLARIVVREDREDNEDRGRGLLWRTKR